MASVGGPDDPPGSVTVTGGAGQAPVPSPAAHGESERRLALTGAAAAPQDSTEAADATAAADPTPLPLREGDRGSAVGDLQRRLRAAGWPTDPDPEEVLGPGTRSAIEAFQHQRGLRVDGVCGMATWRALVEAGYSLGSRLLYDRRPMMRGDDVADLQRRLSALGFDTGRVDGIFGPVTAAAVAEFQSNVGLPTDGIVGATTVQELVRVTPRHPELSLVSAVRARERLLRAPRTLTGRRIAIAEPGGLDVLVNAVRRRLVADGAAVVPILHPNESVQATLANTADADVLVALQLTPERAVCRCAYYAGYNDESPGGRRLAELVQGLAAAALGVPADGPHGMALPVLRETRMPAVVCELGPGPVVVQRTGVVASAVADALMAWVATPI